MTGAEFVNSTRQMVEPIGLFTLYMLCFVTVLAIDFTFRETHQPCFVSALYGAEF